MSELDKKKIKFLEEYDGEERTTKFLKELGFTQYNISCYVDMGYLERLSRGIYKIRVKKKEEMQNDESILLCVKKLYSCVEKRDFNQAYIIVNQICEDKIDNKFDKVLFLLYNLLSCILGKNYDYSYAKDLVYNKKELCEYEKLIYEHKFKEATDVLNSLISMMNKNGVKVKEDIKMFQTLTSEVVKIIENSAGVNLRKDFLKRYYVYFINSLRERKHNVALINLDKAILYCDSEEDLKRLNVMREILLSTLEVLKTKKSVNVRRDYYESVTNAEKCFLEAVYAHDFMYACYILEEYPFSNNKMYKTIHYMLLSMFRLSKEMKNYKDFMSDISSLSSEVSSSIEVLDVKTEYTEEMMQEETSEGTRTTEDDEKELKRYNEEIIHKRQYDIFLEYFFNNDFDNAYKVLKSIGSIDGNEKILCDLLESLIDMRDKKRGFEYFSCDYEYSNTRELFDKAIENKDYKVAFRNIGKLTYQNNDEFLANVKVILHEMYELDKLYGIKEKKVPESLKKEELIHQSKQYTKYSYDELYNSVKSGDFDGVFTNLKKGWDIHALDRMELTVYRLIEVLLWLKRGSLKVINEEIDYDGNYFRCFFDAIKYRQVDKIIEYFDIAYEHALDKSELNIYSFIIDALALEFENIENKKIEMEASKEEKIRQKNLVFETNKRVKEILNKGVDLTIDDISELYSLFDTKKDIDTATFIEVCLLDMIDTLVNHPEVNASYFGNIDEKCKENLDCNYEVVDLNDLDIDERVQTLLTYGEYIRAYELVKDTPFNKCLLKYSNDNKIIVRRLLEVFKYLLNRPFVYEKKVDERSVELKKIQSRIKKNDFLGAYANLLASKHIKGDDLNEIAGGIIMSYIGNSIMEQNCYNEFFKDLEESDVNNMRIDLINYKEVLDRSSYKDVQDYQDKYANMQTIYEEKRRELK